MPRKVSFNSQQPDPQGPTFGKVARPLDLQHLQNYMVAVVQSAIKDLLTAGGSGPVVTGLAATLTGNLGLSIATGRVFDLNGVIYDAEAATPLALQAASPAQPRIDVIYATLEVDAPAVEEYAPYRRLPTDAERLAGTIFPNTQVLAPQEFWTRAVLAVHTGTPAANPQVPAVNAGEVALWRVHVAANQTVLQQGDLTDVRVLATSLGATVADLATLTALYNAFVGGGIYQLIDSRYVRRTAPANAPQTMASDLIAPNIGARGDASAAITGNIPASAGHFKQLKRVSPLGVTRGAVTISTEAGDTGLPNSDGYASLDFAFGDLYPAGARIGVRLQHFGSSIYFGTSNQYNNGIERISMIVDEDFAGKVKMPYNLHVLGSITGGVKNFVIDHPLDPDNKNLRHAALEGPQRDLLYRGRVEIEAFSSTVINVSVASGMTAGTVAALGDVANADIFFQNRTNNAVITLTDNQDGTFELESASSIDIAVSWMYVVERIDPLVMALEDSDENGHLIVEENKPNADLDELEAREESVRAEEAAEDTEVEEIVYSQIGKRHYPLHAIQTGDGTIPTRTVMRHTTDMQGNPYVPDLGS